MSTATETIDQLLQRYLALLDEYTALRGALNALQAGLFQSLARANFAAERGVRYYGQDYYDERMQATRRVRITLASSSPPGDGAEASSTGDEGAGASRPVVFAVSLYPRPETAPDLQDGSGAKSAAGEAEPVVAGGGVPADGEKPQAQDLPSENNEAEVNGKQRPTDPLRWFGILTPLPLRQAQGQAIKAVEKIIPRLATISAEMAGVELEVRRARKKRAKAEKAEKAEEKRLLALADRGGQVDATA
ncbi:hypothetical protein VTK56DRAFT_7703 [Thermocarpiscus australiensis]